MKLNHMYYVYLIQSELFSKQLYVGFTENVNERLQAHNYGESYHTKKYKPWKLIAYFAFDSKQKALNFEIYLKSHSGRSFAQKRFW